MKCTRCSTEIPETSKFCPECGAPLASAAAEPAGLVSISRFMPPDLAKKILSHGQSLESERRLVTIVFADISGFTALSEQLDPELITTVLNNCFKGLTSIIYKYEGFVDKFIGDEIMAIFGAPIAHEDDAERAVRASLEMLDFMKRFNAITPVTLPAPLGLHIGINTGTVVAGNVGSDLRMSYSVIGDTVNLAARLVHVAQTGELYISDDTFRIVRSVVAADPPRSVDLKGKSAPVATHRVTGLAGDQPRGARPVRESAFVGRTRELEQLREALTALHQRESRFCVRGEAGVGKSRLKLEIRKLAVPAGAAFFEGACSSYETSTPYYLWNNLLKSILGVDREAPEQELRRYLHDALEIMELDRYEPYIATLLSLRYEEILAEDTQERKARIFEGVRELLRALCRRRRCVIVLEDLHWIDRFSQDLLRFVFNAEPLAPGLFLFLFREEYRHAEPLQQAGTMLIDLNRLDEPDAGALMQARMGAAPVPEDLRRLIYRRTEGNPFFIEETILTLFERKAIRVENGTLAVLNPDLASAIPETVQGIIMARIDRLEDRFKEVLYSASVIGREFFEPVLIEMLKKPRDVRTSIDGLLALDLIFRKEEAREFAYLFKHYLIREVAYNTLLQKKRKELHRLIAQSIEKLYPAELPEFYDLLAFHYEKAEEWEKAANYLGRAGRKVEALFSKDESQTYRERKEEAVSKLYSSTGARRPWLQFLFKVITTAVAMPMGLLILFAFFGMLTIPFTSKPSLYLFILYPVMLVIMGYITYFITSIVFYVAVKSSFTKPAKLYEVTDEGISIRKANNTEIVVPFNEITSLYFQKRPKPLRIGIRFRLWMLLSHPWRAHGTRTTSIFSFLGFSSTEGTVTIIRSRGYSGLEFLKRPWLLGNTEMWAGLTLTPDAPQAFYDEAMSAFTQWRRKHHGPQQARRRERNNDVRYVIRPQYDLRAMLIGALPLTLFLLWYAFLGGGPMLTHKFQQRAQLFDWAFSISWSAAFLLAVLALFGFVFSMRRFINAIVFEFLDDRMQYHFPFKNIPDGEIPYDAITSVRHVYGPPQSWFGLSTIELVTAATFPFNRRSQRTFSLKMLNIKEADTAVRRIREIVFGAA